MLDLEDSTANTWEHNSRGIKSILEALAGRLLILTVSGDKTVGINPSSTVIFTRPADCTCTKPGFCLENCFRLPFRRRDGGLSGGFSAR